MAGKGSLNPDYDGKTAEGFEASNMAEPMEGLPRCTQCNRAILPILDKTPRLCGPCASAAIQAARRTTYTSAADVAGSAHPVGG